MASYSGGVYLCFIVATLLIKTAWSIQCYQCIGTDSNHPFQCNEFLNDDELVPTDCAEIYGSKFCIKQVGRFEASSVLCYQCTSNTTIYCGDRMIHMGGIQPQSCDHVFEAQFCIKQTGGIGTKRFCSSHDLGNYCDYVKQPGDKLEYRSCLYTCTSDGCNPASIPQIPGVCALLLAVLALVYIY